MVLRALIPALVLCLFTTWAGAQIFTITKVEVAGDKVILSYNLIDSIANRSYTVHVYTSADNYVTPLTKVTGHVGLEVKPGGNRQIIWNAKEELGAEFGGDIGLEVRGKVYLPFVRLDGFNDYKKFKRSKTYKITWTGGRGNSVLNFDLYRGTKKITTYPNIANVGQYNLKFDRIRPGKNYTLKISDSKNKDDVVVTDSFRVKRKIPLMLKLIAVAGAGYVIYYQLTKTTNDDIPDPVTPTGN